MYAQVDCYSAGLVRWSWSRATEVYFQGSDRVARASDSDRQTECQRKRIDRGNVTIRHEDGPWSGLWNVRQRQKTAQPHRQESPSGVKLYTSVGSTPLVSPLAFLLRGEPHAALLVRVSAVDSGFCILLARWLVLLLVLLQSLLSHRRCGFLQLLSIYPSLSIGNQHGENGGTGRPGIGPGGPGRLRASR